MAASSPHAQPRTSNTLPQHHYSNYDTISCIQDMPGEPRPKTITTGDAAFFTGCIFFSLLGGFGLNLAINGKKYKEGLTLNTSSKAEIPKHIGAGGKVVLEDPMVLATRALGWGTLFAIIGSGAVGLATAYILKT